MALLPIVCTATVENGSDIVEVTGTDASTGAAVVLSDINCRPNATVFLAGAGYIVAERVDTTSFRIERDYAGADASGVSCSISPFTPEMANRAELATALRTTTALTQLLQARGNGLHYFALGATGSGDPGAGKVSYVGASWAAATALCIDVLDAVGRSRAGLLARWKLGDTLIVESIATASYVAYELTEAPSSQDSGAWYLLENFTLVASDGALVDGEAVRLVELAAGDLGPAYTYNEEVANVAARAAYDDEAAGFRVFVKDSGVNGRSAVDQRTGAAGTWERLAYYTGPKGDPGSGMMVAVTNEATAITTGAAKVTFRAPNALTLTGIRASLTTASSTGAVQVDVNVDGVSILSTKITIDEGEKTSVTAAIPPVLSDTTIPDDAEITIDIDAAGTGATGLKVTVIGTQA